MGGSELHQHAELSQSGFVTQCHTVTGPYCANPIDSNGLSPLYSPRIDGTQGSYSCDNVLCM